MIDENRRLQIELMETEKKLWFEQQNEKMIRLMMAEFEKIELDAEFDETEGILSSMVVKTKDELKECRKQVQSLKKFIDDNAKDITSQS